jgi:hypothetical protein
MITGTYPRSESSFGFVFLNFLLPLVPLWLNVQLSSLQHPSWSEEFPFPELRLPKDVQQKEYAQNIWLGEIISAALQETSWLLDTIFMMLWWFMWGYL